MAKEYKISSERLKELEDELHYLKTTREAEVIEEIKVARSFGDLSENSEYDEARDQQAKLYARIAEVEDILAHAVVIDDAVSEGSDYIGLGSLITVKDLELNEEEEYTIVGSQEANPRLGRISDDSPFGRAILGKREGDKVTVEAPEGAIEFLIIKVAKQ
ncbi:MAG: transcription elongation factor GreA [Clostridia bacterium]|nr:transcription elongation factor GreA [Clostridia bacterium]